MNRSSNVSWRRKSFVERLFPVGEIGLGGGDNVHGEFGDAFNWPIISSDIEEWLTDPYHEREITAVIEALVAGTPWAEEALPAFRAKMLKDLRFELVPHITRIANDPSYAANCIE